MNWKTIVGGLLIFGALKEITTIIIDYHSGKLAFWPFGADVGCFLLAVAGIYLIRLGQKEQKKL